MQPHGPHTISQNGQVVIPRAVLQACNLKPGDSVYVTVTDDGDGTIMLVPAPLGAEWFGIGKSRGRD